MALQILSKCIIILDKYIIFRFQQPPLTIELLLANESYIQGTYLQGRGLINHHPYWTKENGSQAIWYHWYTSDWIIGEVTHLGQLVGKIFGNADKNLSYPNPSPPITFSEIGMLNAQGRNHVVQFRAA